jgi:hypothetical protein
MVAKPCAGQNLCVGNNRNHKPLLTDEVADRRVRGIVKRVLAIEKADDRVGIEDYRHSLRSPSTCLRRSPPVSRHPE